MAIIDVRYETLTRYSTQKDLDDMYYPLHCQFILEILRGKDLDYFFKNSRETSRGGFRYVPTLRFRDQFLCKKVVNKE